VPSRDPAQVRQGILAATYACVARWGLAKTSVEDAAREAGVSRATVYRYFRSKEHLLAAALEDWQKRLTRRILAARSSTDEGPLPGILDYLQRAQRAFHRNPNMTALMLQAMTSADPEAKAAIDHMNRTNVEMFNRLLEGVAEDDIPNVSFGINGALSNALAGVLAGMLTLDESLDRVEWIARTLIGATTPRPG